MNEIFKIAQGESKKIRFQSHKDVQDVLNQLHDYYELSWPKIAALPAFNKPGEDPIPIGTISKIAKTGVVPKKHRDRFPGIGAIDNRERISISKRNMKSAKDSIMNNLEIDDIIDLIDLLTKDKRIQERNQP